MNGLPTGDFNMPPGVSVRDVDEGWYPSDDDQIVPLTEDERENGVEDDLTLEEQHNKCL